MTNAVRAAGLAILLAATGGCSRSPLILPEGVITPGGGDARGVVDGIYPVTSPADACCWVQPRSHFRVAAPEAMTDLAIQIFVPDIPMFHARPEGMVVTINGTYRVTKCCYSPGEHTALVTVPPSLRESTNPLDVSLAMRDGFVPSKMNPKSGDSRLLAVVLVGVGYRSF